MQWTYRKFLSSLYEVENRGLGEKNEEACPKSQCRASWVLGLKMRIISQVSSLTKGKFCFGVCVWLLLPVTILCPISSSTHPLSDILWVWLGWLKRARVKGYLQNHGYPPRGYAIEKQVSSFPSNHQGPVVPWLMVGLRSTSPIYTGIFTHELAFLVLHSDFSANLPTTD